MQHDWVFATHGMSVQVEHNDRLKYFQRAGNGAIVRQAGGWNWFHFAIPTPNQIDGDTNVVDVFLNAHLNKYARITRVHIWDGLRKVIGRDSLDLGGPGRVNYNLNIPDEKASKVSHGLSVCVHVEFLPAPVPYLGEVTFLSAAARFRSTYGQEVLD